MTHLSDILGQDAAVSFIARAYRGDRLPHGLVFAGPVGVGKGTAAEALAGLFLCERPATDAEPCPRACGACPSCVVFAAGNHPDFHRVYRQLIREERAEAKARDLAIDVVRTHLVGPAALTSAMNRGKVFLVEEADLMNAAAQNALLKTLEEPASRTLIILLTDQPGDLLPTIRSRCQLVRFAPLEASLVRRELERRGVAPADAQAAAAVAEGSLGLALRWGEDGVVSAADDLFARLDALLAGRPDADLADFLKKAADDYATRQLQRDEKASKDQLNREGITLFLRLATGHLRKRLATAAADDPEALERICQAIDAAARSETFVAANVNVGLIFQQLATTWDQTLAHQGTAR